MLALNKILQKVGELVSVQFSKIGYSQFEAISTYLTKKADVIVLLKTWINVLIRVTKTIDQAVIGAKTLERWHSLKVYGISLERYLGEGKIELFRWEVKFSTEI